MVRTRPARPLRCVGEHERGRARRRALPALQRGDGVAARHLAVPSMPVQAGLLRGRGANELRRASASSVRRRVSFVALALLVLVGVVWLLAHAAEADTYYQSGDVSRWEHARGSNAWIVFAAAIALGIASIAGLVIFAAGKAERLGRAVIGLTVVALLSFPVAWVAVTTGH